MSLEAEVTRVSVPCCPTDCRLLQLLLPLPGGDRGDARYLNGEPVPPPPPAAKPLLDPAPPSEGVLCAVDSPVFIMRAKASPLSRLMSVERSDSWSCGKKKALRTFRPSGDGLGCPLCRTGHPHTMLPYTLPCTSHTLHIWITCRLLEA